MLAYIRRFSFIASCCILASGAAFSATSIGPLRYQAMLKKGLDVDWAKTGPGKTNYKEKAVKDFKDAGLSHVRIRIKDETDQELLKLLDTIVADCTKYKMVPVIAYQADYFKKKPNAENMQKAVEWWKTIAEHGKNYPPEVSFDLIIEVTDALNLEPKTLNNFYEAAVKEIRKTNPERIIFISPRIRSSPEYLQDLVIPSAHNNRLMAEWHFFAAGPDPNNPKKQWTTGSNEEKAVIKQKIWIAQDWSKKTGIKTWVGAWMPGDYNKLNSMSMSQQIEFARFVSCELSRAKIPFAVNSDTKFYDRKNGTWIKEMKPLLNQIIRPSGC